MSSQSSPTLLIAASTTPGGTAVRTGPPSHRPCCPDSGTLSCSWPAEYTYKTRRRISVLGPVRPRLEPPRPRLPPPPRLSFFHLLYEGEQAYRYAHHLFSISLRSRTCHVVLVQKTSRVFARFANVPATGVCNPVLNCSIPSTSSPVHAHSPPSYFSGPDWILL